MAFFLTDDLNQQDKLEELGKIRDAINALGGQIEPLGDNPAEIAKEVSKIIKQFDILWVRMTNLISPTKIIPLSELRNSFITGKPLFRKNQFPILMLIQYWLDYQFLFVWYWNFLMMERLQMVISLIVQILLSNFVTK